MRLIVCAFAIILHILIFPCANAQNATTDYYKITLTIEKNGKIIGTPQFVTEPGASAIMANDKAGYSFKTDVGSNGGLDSASINISTELYFAQNDKWELFGKPTIFAPIGKQSSMSLSTRKFGDVQLSYRIDRVSNLASNFQNFGKNKCTDIRVAEWKESLTKPVSYVPPQGRPTICCRFCNGMARCCSSGPICCSDSTNCGSDSCCNGVPT